MKVNFELTVFKKIEEFNFFYISISLESRITNLMKSALEEKEF